MTGSQEKNDFFSRIRAFKDSKDPVVSFARDILWVLGVVGIIAVSLFLISGTWPAVVAVESESMVPNMQVGDLVFVVQKDRFGELQTWTEGEISGYARFADHPDISGNDPYGDVIIYRPNGEDGVHPIIHRAIEWVEGPPHPGYRTKGDNNLVADQDTIYVGIGRIEPVKEEWVVGKALFAVPLIGYLPLHIAEFAILIIVLLVVHELYSKMKREGREDQKRRRPKKKG